MEAATGLPERRRFDGRDPTCQGVTNAWRERGPRAC